MRRSIVSVLLFCMTMVCAASITMAGPAPKLTQVDIYAFTAENYNHKWKLSPASYPKSMNAYSFSGPELYMRVIYTGDPNWSLTFIKVNGAQYKHSQLFTRQTYITSGDIITGYDVVYRMPAAYLSNSNTVAVNSSGTNGGSAGSVSTNVIFIKR